VREAASEREMRLGDGRLLAYRELGDPAGPAVVFCHGWPGSRLDFEPNAGAAAAAGVRVLAIDRPGIGRSDPLPGRRVADWPADVAALADGLGLERISVMGFSFGGPYARACALALGERVTRVDLVSCLGPLDAPGATREMPPPTRYGLGAARLSPLLARPMVAVTARAARGGKLVPRLARSMAPPDAEVLARPEVARGLAASLTECFRQGTAAATWDGVAVARDEGFALEELTAEVAIWHGEEDRNDPVAMALDQERRLPGARAKVYPGEGHLIFFSRIEEILADLAAQAAR
jgi:pimeloyl-ACP methyl ester carboxylesterase